MNGKFDLNELRVEQYSDTKSDYKQKNELRKLIEVSPY